MQQKPSGRIEPAGCSCPCHGRGLARLCEFGCPCRCHDADRATTPIDVEPSRAVVDDFASAEEVAPIGIITDRDEVDESHVARHDIDAFRRDEIEEEHDAIEGEWGTWREK